MCKRERELACMFLCICTINQRAHLIVEKLFSPAHVHCVWHAFPTSNCAMLLQALRLRLARSQFGPRRAGVMASFVDGDILGITSTHVRMLSDAVKDGRVSLSICFLSLFLNV